MQGPLKNEILVLRHSRFHFGLQGNFNYRHKEQLLSIVALYLQRKPADCNSVPIALADLSNYMNKPCNKGNQNIFKSVATLIDKAGYSYKGRPLFFKECLADSCTKLSVDAQWLIDWDVHLAPAEKAVRSGYVWYDDDLLRRS